MSLPTSLWVKLIPLPCKGAIQSQQRSSSQQRERPICILLFSVGSWLPVRFYSASQAWGHRFHIYIHTTSILIYYYHRLPTIKSRIYQYRLLLNASVDQLWICKSFFNVTPASCLLNRSEFDSLIGPLKGCC
jgi:hypothetical protein